jgi:hypothetical protein
VFDGVNATPSVTPLLHVYDVAPPPLSVTCAPWQTDDAVVFAAIVGSGFTVTVTVAVFVQPLEFVPVTV